MELSLNFEESKGPRPINSKWIVVVKLQVGEKPLRTLYIYIYISPTDMEQARIWKFYHSQLISWLI